MPNVIDQTREAHWSFRKQMEGDFAKWAKVYGAENLTLISGELPEGVNVIAEYVFKVNDQVADRYWLVRVDVGGYTMS